MVQQVASLKTDSAASALPLNANAFSASLLNNHSQSGQSFNAEFIRQTQQLAVNRQPTINQVQSVTPSKRFNDSADLRDDTVHSNRRDPITDKRQETSAAQDRQRSEQSAGHRNDSSNVRQDVQAKSKDATTKYHQRDNAYDNASDNSRASVNKTARTDIQSSDTQQDLESANADVTTEPQPKSAIKQHSDAEFTNEHELDTNSNQKIGDKLEQKLSDAELNDDAINHYGNPDTKFDYISFVTQLAEFGQEKADTNTDLAQSALGGSLNTDTDGGIDSLLVDELINPLTLAKSESGRLNTELSEQQQEFSNINLSVDDLQTILDAKNIELDLNAQLSQSELRDLQAIISDMLNQLQSQESGGESVKVSQDVKGADEALLVSLLLGNEASKSSKESSSKSALDAVNAKLNDVGKSGINEPVGSKVNAQADVDKMTEKNVMANKLGKEGLESPESAKLVTDILIPKVVSTTNKSPTNIDVNDVNKTPMQNLAALNEEQTQIALDNVKQRMQSISSELSGEKVGNEFIAALQSGVKEFKQQLAQGREPGIDLKAIISEALAAANVDVSGKSPKIDATINQINSVMNLANSVNHSASLQQSQLLGLNESQLSKDMAQISIESSRSASTAASASANQANAQATADKAMNIFKQEGQKQLAEKVRWMVNNKSASAEIRLDPPDLGGVNIKVSMNGDNAQVNFNVQSNAAKEALDQATPRLREMLQEQGIELGQSSVQQDNSQQQNENNEHSFANSEKNSGNGMQIANEDSQEQEIGTVVEQRVSNGSLGGIDYYA